MESLKAVGKRYNQLCDSIDEELALLRADRRKRLDTAARATRLKALRLELKAYRASLEGKELEAYRDYRAVRMEIKRCKWQKKCDNVEKRVFKKLNPAYIYMIPAAFGAIFFTLLPFIFMLIGAFFKVDLVSIRDSRFVGLWNFEMIFTRDNEFVRAIGNTILFAFLTVFLLMAVTVLTASWLSKNTHIHNLSQTLVFTPHISSMVAVSILWVLMLDPQGIINQVLALFGITGPNWLMDTRTSLVSVALVTVWKSIGYYSLIIIAGLQSMPAEIYEAARLDKAGRWTVLRRITIPLLAPTLSFVFIMKFINSFKAFAAIDVMTQGGPQGSSMVLGYWVYTAGRVKFNYGFAMAGAIVLTGLVALFTYFANRAFKRKGD